MKPSQTWSIRSVLLLLCGAVIVVTFQNCGDVKLAEKVEATEFLSQAYRGKITVLFCPSMSAASASTQFNVSSVTVSNLNSAAWNGQAMADSDADGIPDQVEASLGYDPENRRSKGILDGICHDHGGADTCMRAVSCVTTTVAPGLSGCDLRSYLAPSAATPQGVDSDMDGIPDFIEALRGTNPVAFDSLADSDHDRMTNAAEYTQGQDLRSGTMLQAFDQVKYTVTPTADACGTGQTLVKIEISNVPLVPTVAFADADPYLSVAGNLNLSHDRHENLLMISVVSTPTNPAVKSEISVAYQLMDFDRPEESGDLDNSHFVFLGPLN